MKSMRPRRALLYMPGDDMRKIRKATTLDIDSICMDIEDAVAASRKISARAIIVEALNTLNFGRSERLVRISPVGSGSETADLQAVLPANPDGIVIPKVTSPSHIQWASHEIARYERGNNLPAGHILLLAMVETAQGIVNLREIASCDARLQGLIFGAEDLANDLGAVRTREGWEVFYARSAVITYAAAFGLQAIDMVFTDFNNTEALRAECQQAAGMGYTGKQAIHPNQVAPIQDSFIPSEDAIAHARRIVEAAEQHQKEGHGAFALDGKMIDAPVVKAAERVLARARAAGL